ncbi:hypothetical protein LSH36_1027g01056 [Paralvinella palmiformis]|uniref:Uncharacterized protein n=1 Tax=Paralvinella palmiformis TaxID=53620 RepID=A0AAD9MRW7_9ANNE|nr:hypothetical protein LSH36_1027g01056 [Paralvinella palmiformis]
MYLTWRVKCSFPSITKPRYLYDFTRSIICSPIEKSKTFCSCRQSVKGLTLLEIRTRSSVYAWSYVPLVTASSSIMMTRVLNRVIPIIDPCGMPVSVGCSLELNPLRKCSSCLSLISYWILTCKVWMQLG